MKRLILIVLFSLSLLACGGGGGSDSSDSEGTESESAQAGEGSTQSTSELLRILPLGDSITEGSSGQHTYRYFLWHLIQGAGFNIDFVGSRNGVLGGGAPDPNFDQDHEGHYSWRTDELLDYGFEIWSQQYPADIALVHLGTNDMREDRSVGQALANFTRIISLLRMANPRVLIVLAQVLPSSRANSEISQFNAALPGYAASMSTEESEIIVVDQNTGFSVSADLRDGVHPNERGEQKMAQNWFNAIAPYLVAFAEENQDD